MGVRLARTPGPPAEPEEAGPEEAGSEGAAAALAGRPGQQHARRRLRGHRAAVPGPVRRRVGSRDHRGVPPHHGRCAPVASGSGSGSPPSTGLWRDIIADPPDLVVVTGSNPLEPRIEDEPYWSDLCGLLQWGSEHVPALLLSCLSAHAALLTYDGIERTTLPQKCTGVFAQQADPDHPLAAGLGSPIVLPHSRLNAVAPDTVLAAGYRVALASEEVGWSVITKTVGRAQVVLVQGHPEYDPSSLVREYHRDVRRYAGHERDELPCLPRACVGEPDWSRLQQLHRTGGGGRAGPRPGGLVPLRGGR